MAEASGAGELFRAVQQSASLGNITMHNGKEFMLTIFFNRCEDAQAFRQAVLDIYNPTN